jgi:phosphoribosylaminoimidazole carboxylase PurE protein
MAGRVVIIMGSKSDLDHVDKIVAGLGRFGIPCDRRVASAHKSASYLLGMLASYKETKESIVCITVAGRSNALGGMVDANVTYPVITCPPVSSTFGGADIYSSLRMPSGVAPLVVLDPGGAALAAAKILALADPDLAARIAAYQSEMTETVLEADRSLT